MTVKLKIGGVADAKLDGACKECLKSLVPAPERPTVVNPVGVARELGALQLPQVKIRRLTDYSRLAPFGATRSRFNLGLVGFHPEPAGSALPLN